MKLPGRLRRRFLLIALFGTGLVVPATGQFLSDFSQGTLALDPRGLHGWGYFTGDGQAVMDFSQSKGYASIFVDATKDQRGIWWALIKHLVSERMDLARLRLPHHELRIEARVRVSDAPKRVNLSLNTQRTTDFHTNLMEFDIADTNNWHTISMTSRGFDAVPGDSIYGQLALMDWGLEKYRVDLQYFKVDIVRTDSVPPDRGVSVPYHPPLLKKSAFAQHIAAAENAMIDLQYPDFTFGAWSDVGGKEPRRVLTVSPTQFIIMRWDLKAFGGRKAAGAGELELTTYALQRSPAYQKDFGMVRVCEILGGSPAWVSEEVTTASFCGGVPLTRVINSQMIIDS